MVNSQGDNTMDSRVKCVVCSRWHFPHEKEIADGSLEDTCVNEEWWCPECFSKLRTRMYAFPQELKKLILIDDNSMWPQETAILAIQTQLEDLYRKTQHENNRLWHISMEGPPPKEVAASILFSARIAFGDLEDIDMSDITGMGIPEGRARGRMMMAQGIVEDIEDLVTQINITTEAKGVADQIKNDILAIFRRANRLGIEAQRAIDAKQKDVLAQVEAKLEKCEDQMDGKLKDSPLLQQLSRDARDWVRFHTAMVRQQTMNIIQKQLKKIDLFFKNQPN